MAAWRVERQQAGKDGSLIRRRLQLEVFLEPQKSTALDSILIRGLIFKEARYTTRVLVCSIKAGQPIASEEDR